MTSDYEAAGAIPDAICPLEIRVPTFSLCGKRGNPAALLRIEALMSELSTITRYFDTFFAGAERLIAQGKSHAPMLVTVKSNGESVTAVTVQWPEDAVQQYIQGALAASDTVFVVKVRQGPRQVEVVIGPESPDDLTHELLTLLQRLQSAQQVLAFEFYGYEGTYLALCPIDQGKVMKPPLLLTEPATRRMPPPASDTPIH